MNNTKRVFITGFALFSLFFGAGNLILPPFLGFKAGTDWLWVGLGFMVSAVLLPLLGILAHARLQGTMLDFGKKVSPGFALIYCIIVYAISLTLPAPRTASVTHEMAISPFIGGNPWLTSSIYFILVLVFVLNRSKILDIIGKLLTPMIGLILLAIIGIGILSFEGVTTSTFPSPTVSGLLEGYQTFDAIGAVVIGGVIIISLHLKGVTSFEEKRQLITKAGLIAGLGLLIIYIGLIYLGAHYTSATEGITRTQLLSSISTTTLGNVGYTFLSVLVALACFTTAVGIITGASDFMKGIFKESKTAYVITAIVGCLLGVVMGQFDVHYIIDVAVPALMFIYPITIVLILLNILPDTWGTIQVFRVVVVTTILFSIPDFLATVGMASEMQPIKDLLPLGNHAMGWVLPSVIVFILAQFWRKSA